jgi:hypothetical protein
MQGKSVVLAWALALVVAAPAHAQLGVDQAHGLRLTASDRNVLATWSDGGTLFSAILDTRGRVVSRTESRDTGATGGFVVTGPRTAYNARTRRYLMAWAGPDGVRLRQFRRDGKPVGGARRIVPLPFPNAAFDVFDLDADPVGGTTVLSVSYMKEQSGPRPEVAVLQIPIDRRGNAGSPLEVQAAAVAARRDGGFLALSGVLGDLYLQRLSGTGRLSGPLRRLTDTPVEEGGPKLAVHPRSGEAMAFWTGLKGVVAQPLSAAGAPGAPVTIRGTGGHGAYASLAPYGRDGWVVAYQQEIAGLNEIVVRRLDAGGHPDREPVIVNPGNADPWAHSPSLAVVGRAVVVGYGHQGPAGFDRIATARVAI